jgi:hypothetical protein
VAGGFAGNEPPAGFIPFILFAGNYQSKTHFQKTMKNLKRQLRLASLLSLMLLACSLAFGQLTPTGDSYTNTAASTTNYGAKTLLDVESTQTSFIQFNLASIPAGYTSADITKATLKLYVNAVTTAGSFNVDYANGTWSESTIDASNAPALGTTIAASVPLVAADKNQYILVDVTAAVQAWLSGTPNDGIALVANSPLNASFDSKENTTTSHAAELDIVFAGGTLTGITTASGSGLTGGGTSGTLNLSLTSACAANQVLQYNGTSWVCAAVGTGTITGVTPGTDLTGGGTSGNVTLSLNTTATNAMYAQLGAANTFTGNQAVNGTVTASATGNGVIGNTSSASGYGVEGTGPTIGVYGQSAQASLIGMEEDIAAAGAGSWGDSASSVGVVGTSDNSFAGAFYSASNLAETLYTQNATGNGGGAAFVAEVPYTETSGTKVLAIIGDPGCGQGDNRIAIQLSQNGMRSCTNYTLTAGNNGETYVNANASETVHLRVNNVDALVASGSGVNVVGTLSKGGGSFKIDHPLDPANKYLYHSFVESPDMMNIYNGVAELDASGEAVIALPDWFQALNKDFRYQLTPIGAPGPNLYIAEEVANNQFKMAGGKPGSRVSWQVTGIRQDAFANANRIPVEVEKAPADRGRYLYPEVIGAPETARIGYEAIPPESKPGTHQRPTLPRLSEASPVVGPTPLKLRIPRRPVLPNVAPLPHVAPLPPPAQASKPEINQK